MKRRSGIRRMFVRGFLGVLATTALFSIVAVGVVLFLVLQVAIDVAETEQPATSVQRYAKDHAGALLSGAGSARSGFEARFRRAEGVDYALLDARGEPLAGDPSGFEPLPSVEQISGDLGSSNASKVSRDGRYVENAVPLVQDGRIDGYLLLKYELSFFGNPALGTAEKAKLGSLLVLSVLLPVVLLAASILLFARRASGWLGRPIGELRAAVDKIRERDLDFTIDYDEPDELGELCGAFRELRDELESSLEREWRGRQELEDTLATLSHDLRTPATVIRGHVEALSRVRDDDKRAERLEQYLPVLDAAARRMSKLLDAILLASDPKPDPNGSLEGLAREISRKARTYELLARERGVTFSLETSAGAVGDDRAVSMDLLAFERVLDNLFENALAFTPEGGAISVEASWDRCELRMAVRDTGPGLDPGDLPHVFEKGYRGKREGAYRGNRSGLGLYISRFLVRRSGGRIRVENRSGGGLEATFTLALAEAQKPYQAPAGQSIDGSIPEADNR